MMSLLDANMHAMQRKYFVCPISKNMDYENRITSQNRVCSISNITIVILQIFGRCVQDGKKIMIKVAN